MDSPMDSESTSPMSEILNHQTLYNVDMKQRRGDTCIRMWLTLHLEEYKGDEDQMNADQEMLAIIKEIYPMMRLNISDPAGTGKFHISFRFHNAFHRATDLDIHSFTPERILHLMKEAVPLDTLYGGFCFFSIFYHVGSTL